MAVGSWRIAGPGHCCIQHDQYGFTAVVLSVLVSNTRPLVGLLLAPLCLDCVLEIGERLKWHNRGVQRQAQVPHHHLTGTTTLIAMFPNSYKQVINTNDKHVVPFQTPYV